MPAFPDPPPLRPPAPQFHTVPAGDFLVRLFDPTAHGATARSFRHNGPRARFDHHRHPPERPAEDPSRGIYYAARTLSGCVVEIFGDTGLILTGEWHVARPRLTRPLRLLDLRGSGAMQAGTTARIAKVEHAHAQRWSRHFYEDPAYHTPGKAPCDGLLYFNAHNDQEALALYERAENALDCPPTQILRLDHPGLRPALLHIARANHLVAGP